MYISSLKHSLKNHRICKKKEEPDNDVTSCGTEEGEELWIGGGPCPIHTDRKPDGAHSNPSYFLYQNRQPCCFSVIVKGLTFKENL